MAFANYSAALKALETTFGSMQKTLTRTAVTKTTDGNGDERLTDGATNTIYGPFFKKDEIRKLQKYAQLIQDADAILLVWPDVVVNRDDKITFNSETFRVDQKIVRFIGPNEAYHAYQCFRVS